MAGHEGEQSLKLQIDPDKLKAMLDQPRKAPTAVFCGDGSHRPYPYQGIGDGSVLVYMTKQIDPQTEEVTMFNGTGPIPPEATFRRPIRRAPQIYPYQKP